MCWHLSISQSSRSLTTDCKVEKEILSGRLSVITSTSVVVLVLQGNIVQPQGRWIGLDVEECPSFVLFGRRMQPVGQQCSVPAVQSIDGNTGRMSSVPQDEGGFLPECAIAGQASLPAGYGLELDET